LLGAKGTDHADV